MDPKDELQNHSEPKSHGKKWSFSKEDMDYALEHLRSGKSIRQTSRITNVPYATVRRYWLKQKGYEISRRNLQSQTSASSSSTSNIKSILKKNNDSSPNKVKSDNEEYKTFTEEQEMELASLFNGKNGTDCRKIAYEMAVQWNVSLHKIWSNEEMANIEWIANFRKRLPDLLEKQYKNNQIYHKLSKENLSTHDNDNSLPKTTDTLNSCQFTMSTNSVRRNSGSSDELDSFGNESSSSNHELDVKIEPNEYQFNRKQSSTTAWGKKISSNSSLNKREKSNVNFFNANNSEDIKLFSSDRNNENNSNIAINEKNNSTLTEHDLLFSGRDNQSHFVNSNLQQTYQPQESFEEIGTSFLRFNNTNNHLNQEDRTNEPGDSNISERPKQTDVHMDQNFSNFLSNSKGVSKQNMDADELFLLSLLPALKKIPEKDKIKARIKLLEVMDQF
ncbi:putative uncharacterized protein DDB_G0282133 [Condylostylus longicornis]|uniref:putative uncharacterized protein DDB_G0282133 n=1 Tax=Condylostylus longicornis TaxID=2530218 RepID=UPI00244D9F48|nr:putative uncharacterized protein DDB_G0282133 [Condylostylus longicornis]